MKHITPPTPTTDLKTALLAAHGKHIRHAGRDWRLDCHEIKSHFYGYAVFTCNAENLTPANADEREFCITDLWQSHTENSDQMTMKFARLGGYAQ